MTILHNSNDGSINKCPFCKGKEVTVDFTGRYYRVLCLNPSCCAIGPSKLMQETAIGAWCIVTQCP